MVELSNRLVADFQNTSTRFLNSFQGLPCLLAHPSPTAACETTATRAPRAMTSLLANYLAIATQLLVTQTTPDVSRKIFDALRLMVRHAPTGWQPEHAALEMLLIKALQRGGRQERSARLSAG